jgi:hypothetical protein
LIFGDKRAENEYLNVARVLADIAGRDDLVAGLLVMIGEREGES